MPKRAPQKPVTIRDWHDGMPSAKVSRAELMRVLEGFGFITRDEVAAMFRRERAERKWHIRLWRWIKLRFKKKNLEDLSPAVRQELQHKLSEIDARSALTPNDEKVREAIQKPSPIAKQVQDG